MQREKVEVVDNATDILNEKEMTAKLRFKANRYKIISYPIIAFVSYLIMNIVIYTYMPQWNAMELSIFGNNPDLATVLVHYPKIICIDFALMWLGYQACRLFSKFLIQTVKSIIEKYDAKQARKEARFGKSKKSK